MITTLALALTLSPPVLPFNENLPLHGFTDLRSSVPPPDEVLGHRIGERHSRADQVVEYFELVGRLSDRVAVQRHGMSYQGRPLLHAVITSPANHGRLEEIRQRNLRLSEAPQEFSDADLADMPIVIWMGYGVHGNEASAHDAAILTLYALAAGEGPGVEAILENTVIVMDPLINPDGITRFVDWVNGNRGTVATSDPRNREHLSPWPGGRSNHYLFDLNRDWLLVQQWETEQRLKVFHHWRPQLLTDHHEMGGNSTWYFDPAVPDRLNPLVPENNFQMTVRLAEFLEQTFDEVGQLYVSREMFDDFYPGYGSSYADLNGGVAILFEQASSRALIAETINGPLHYRTTVRNQVAGGLTVAAGAVELREDFLRNQREFYASARDFARDTGVGAYMVSLKRGRDRAEAFMKLMQAHQIEVHELGAAAEGHEPGEALMIPVDQRQARLLVSMMEPFTDFDFDSFYDTSSWHMPSKFDLDVVAMRGNVARYVGERVISLAYVEGRIHGRADFAYAIPWGHPGAAKLLYDLQDAGTLVRRNLAFSAEVAGREMEFAAGTLVVPVTQAGADAETIHRIVREGTAMYGVDAFGLSSSRVLSGPDLGSNRLSVLRKPEVAIMTGSGTSSLDVGNVWFLLSQRLPLPVSLVDRDVLAGSDLSRYNVIILTSAPLGSMNSDLESWVRRGGTLIVMRGAMNWAGEANLMRFERVPFATGGVPRGLSYQERREFSTGQSMPGTIFRGAVDNTHPLAYGLPEELPFYQQGMSLIRASEGNTVMRVAGDDILISGFVTPEQERVLPNTGLMLAERVGQGAVIGFTFNPLFRNVWYGTQPLVINSIFFGPSF